MPPPSDRDVLVTAEGRQIALCDGLSIGRSETETVQIVDSAVSRQHAIVHHRAGRWMIQDCGSRNGTRLNDARLPGFTDAALRDGDRIGIGRQTLRVQLAPTEDPEQTSGIMALDASVFLSPYQLQVIALLAEPWLRGHEPATNAEIAERLGTPNASEAVKAALRRCYVKTGLSALPTHTKRRELCRLASERGWV